MDLILKNLVEGTSYSKENRFYILRNNNLVYLDSFKDYLTNTFDPEMILFDFMCYKLPYNYADENSIILFPTDVIVHKKANCFEVALFVKAFCNYYKIKSNIIAISFYDDFNHKMFLKYSHALSYFQGKDGYYSLDYLFDGLGVSFGPYKSPEILIEKIETEKYPTLFKESLAYLVDNIDYIKALALEMNEYDQYTINQMLNSVPYPVITQKKLSREKLLIYDQLYLDMIEKRGCTSTDINTFGEALELTEAGKIKINKNSFYNSMRFSPICSNYTVTRILNKQKNKINTKILNLLKKYHKIK